MNFHPTNRILLFLIIAALAFGLGIKWERHRQTQLPRFRVTQPTEQATWL